MSINSYSQLELVTKNITLSNINTRLKEHELINESKGDGPYLYFECFIINNYDRNTVLYPKQSSLKVLFRSEKHLYIKEGVSIVFQDKDSVLLQKKDSVAFFWGTHIFLGTSLWSEEKDYTRELLKILPTLELIYIEPSKKIKGTKILDVKIID